MNLTDAVIWKNFDYSGNQRLTIKTKDGVYLTAFHNEEWEAKGDPDFIIKNKEGYLVGYAYQIVKNRKPALKLEIAGEEWIATNTIKKSEKYPDMRIRRLPKIKTRKR